MTDLQSIAPEVLDAIRDVLTNGYGQVIVYIADGKIDKVEKVESVKVRR